MYKSSYKKKKFTRYLFLNIPLQKYADNEKEIYVDLSNMPDGKLATIALKSFNIETNSKNICMAPTDFFTEMSTSTKIVSGMIFILTDLENNHIQNNIDVYNNYYQAISGDSRDVTENRLNLNETRINWVVPLECNVMFDNTSIREITYTASRVFDTPLSPLEVTTKNMMGFFLKFTSPYGSLYERTGLNLSYYCNIYLVFELTFT